MQPKQSWISEKAFGKDAGCPVIVSYKSHQEATTHLQSALDGEQGIGMLLGPEGSGKTTIAKRIEEMLAGDSAIALVDGTEIKASEMMAQMLARFGYDTGLEAENELEKMIKVFATQQARVQQPPVLIVDNVDRMDPSALRTLNMLAELEVEGRHAMRILLTGRDGLSALVGSEGMPGIQKRQAVHFEMAPLTVRESLIYIHARLAACGVNDGDTIFPVNVCDYLYEQSGGWPGSINEVAIQAMRSATSFPLRLSDTIMQRKLSLKSVEDLPTLGAENIVGATSPSLILSKNGKVVSEYTFAGRKALIGRSDFADVVVDDQFVSKMHAVLLLFPDALIMLDLNSSNGTTVNSVVVRSAILQSNDIISLGNHRLKVRNSPAISDEMAELRQSPDTLKMKSLVDMRNKRKQRLALVKTQSKKQI